MPPRLQPGTAFARDFRVIELLAEGGMGSVWRVEQLSTRKQRALKIVHAALGDDRRGHERFVREATVGASIASEHVVEVIAAGVDEQSGLPYLAMELLSGEDLAALLGRKRRLSPAELLALMRQLCHGLAAAHAAGVVHRDLKPENVFVAHSQRAGSGFTVKILDFGIAKLVQQTRARVTETAAVGSPLWMSPEQLNAERTDPRTDVWALGLLAFWALSGCHYWLTAHSERMTVQALFAEQLFKPIDPPTRRATELGVGEHLVDGFDEWFARCVVREVDLRYADAAEAFAALEPILGAAAGEGEGAVDLLAGIELGAAATARARVRYEETQEGGSSATLAPSSTATESLPPSAIETRMVETGGVTGSGVDVMPPGAPARRWPWLLGGAVVLLVAGTMIGIATSRKLRREQAEQRRDRIEAKQDAREAKAERKAAREAKPVPDAPPPAKTAPPAAAAPTPTPSDPVRPLRTQTSFSSADFELLGWSADGRHFAIEATHPDRDADESVRNRLRLVELREAYTTMVVESYLRERDADPAIDRLDRLAKAAAEAEPIGQWRARERTLALAPSTAARKLGTIEIIPSSAEVPEGTTWSVESTESGARFAWSGFEQVSRPSAARGSPRLVLHVAVAEERWEALDVPLAFGLADVMPLALGDPTRVSVTGEATVHWSPRGDRFLVAIRARAHGIDGTHDLFDARWFVRAVGPQLRVVEAGAGQTAAWAVVDALCRAGLPVAMVELGFQHLERSAIRVRDQDAQTTVLVGRIDELVATPLAIENRKSGWTAATIVLGRDASGERP